MDFNINDVVDDVKSAIEGIYQENYASIKDMTEAYLEASKTRLESLLVDATSGAIDSDFFNKRIADEQAILESQLISFKVAGVSLAKEAANAAIQILFKIINSLTGL